MFYNLEAKSALHGYSTGLYLGLDERVNLILLHVNNKGADQSAPPHSLCNTIVIRCLESILAQFAPINFQYSS